MGKAKPETPARSKSKTRSKTSRTWQEKLAAAKAKPDLPKVFFCDEAKKKFVVPSVGEVEQMMASVPPGRLMTMPQISQRLSRAHGADLACPMATGIFAWIVAHAAEEEAGTGNRAPLPWWRVLKKGGLLNPKYPGGGALQKQRLQAEGHRVVVKGKNLLVADHEQALVD